MVSTIAAAEWTNTSGAVPGGLPYKPLRVVSVQIVRRSPVANNVKVAATKVQIESLDFALP